jgi:hypothetical protein
MKTKNYFFLLITALLSVPVSAQKNVSKTGIFPGPLFRMFSTSQERKLGKRITTVTTLKAMPPVKFKGGPLSLITHGDQTYNPFANAKLSAVGNITEFRIYKKKEEREAPKGLYFGPYFSYTFFKLNAAAFPAEFQDNNQVTYKADLQEVIKVNVIGGGLQVGVQGLIKNKIAIDWTILGIGFGSLKITGSIDATNTSDNFDFRNYDEDVANTTLGIDKLIPIKKTVEKESVSLSAKAPWLLIKTGLSIGIAY